MSKAVIQAGWADAPHLDEETKSDLASSYPPHERDARMYGKPVLGSGAVFPVDLETIKCTPFTIAPHWPQIVGMDFGWRHPSAASRLAWDRDNDIVYVTACYRASEQTPVLFAAAIKPWGTWIPVAWPHDGLQHDKGSGIQLKEQYAAQGLNMLPDHATHAPADGQDEGQGGYGLEAGIMDMLDRMHTGRLKVFANLEQWFEEARLYHRDEKGLIVKMKDDILSSTRIGIMSLRHAITKPAPRTNGPRFNHQARRGGY